jgi:hypothetical protein
MGGPGSGSWYMWDNRTTTEEVHRIDIRYMRQQGFLRPGYDGSLSWSCGDRKTGSVMYRVETDSLVLVYRARVQGGEWKSIEEHVRLDRTHCNYGGERVWFLCPDCDRRVAVLALYGSRFVCRHCHKRPYGSQQEGYMERMQRKARKVRKKLGATNNLTEFIWRKPKGMHQKTFDRLRQEEQAANNAAIIEMGKKIGVLERFLL